MLILLITMTIMPIKIVKGILEEHLKLTHHFSEYANRTKMMT